MHCYERNGFVSSVPFGLKVVNNRTLSAFTNGFNDILTQCKKDRVYNMTPDVTTALGYNILLRLKTLEQIYVLFYQMKYSQ